MQSNIILKIYIILVIAFMGIGSFTHTYLSSAVDKQDYCFECKMTLYSDPNNLQLYKSADLYTRGDNFYIDIENFKYDVNTKTKPYRVKIKGQTYYFNL